MKAAVLITRTLLGLIFLVVGLNYFLHFMPLTPVTGKAGDFQAGLFQAGYFFPFLKTVEIISAIFILINRYTALFLLAVLPICINILLFHSFLAHEGLPLGAVMIILDIFLLFAYRSYYYGLLTFKPVPQVS